MPIFLKSQDLVKAIANKYHKAIKIILKIHQAQDQLKNNCKTDKFHFHWKIHVELR